MHAPNWQMGAHSLATSLVSELALTELTTARVWRDLNRIVKARTPGNLEERSAVKNETPSLQRLAQCPGARQGKARQGKARQGKARHAIECPWRSKRLACDWCDLRRRYIPKFTLCCRFLFGKKYHASHACLSELLRSHARSTGKQADADFG